MWYDGSFVNFHDDKNLDDVAVFRNKGRDLEIINLTRSVSAELACNQGLVVNLYRFLLFVWGWGRNNTWAIQSPYGEVITIPACFLHLKVTFRSLFIGSNFCRSKIVFFKD